MRKAERILALLTILGVILRDLTGFIKVSPIILIPGTLLAVIYLFGHWWIDRPQRSSLRTICVSTLYGITSFGLMMSLIFTILFYSQGDQMTFISFSFLIVAIIVDMLSSIRKRKILTIPVSIRIAILLTFTIVLSAIPEDVRISITYRKHPGFLRYYRENKSKMDFGTLEEQYFESSQPSKGV
jgi:hypothetical protein